MRARIRESLRESIVVVGSILIAFALDAWWGRQVETADQAEGLVSLAAEFEADRTSLRERFEDYQRVEDNLVSLQAILSAGLGQPSVEVADSLLVALISAPTYDSRITGLTAFGTSGALSSLEDDVLRRLLAAWPSYVVDAREDQDAAARVVESRVIPLLSSRRQLDRIFPQVLPWRLGEQVVEGVGSVTPSVELLNAIAERRYWDGFVLFELDALRATQDSIVERLRSHIPPR